MKLQVFDTNLGRTHIVPMKLEGHGLVLEGTSGADGYITFSSDEFIEGENYTITVFSNIFSDGPKVITAKNGLDAALTLHPYMPLRITLVTQTAVRNIVDTEIDVYCNTTKVASKGTNEYGVAYIFIEKEFALN